MLNPSHDLATLKSEFAIARRIRIHDVLEPAIAEAITAEMEQLRYLLFCANGKGVAVLDPADVAGWEPGRRAELQQELMAAAARAEGFTYGGYRMTEAWKAGAPETALGRFHTALASPAVRQAIQTITGATTFDNAFAQATRYVPGNYLTRHLDDPSGESRKFAFVWGFTRRWDPDWGGLLQFYDAMNQPADALSPGFNTLDLFDVSHVHAVTYVTPFAQAARLAVSGWFVKGDPLNPTGRGKPQV